MSAKWYACHCVLLLTFIETHSVVLLKLLTQDMGPE